MNGKAIMNGIRLDSLDSADMVDVLHYMFEEDMFVSTGEEAEHKSKVRTTLYKEFYDKDYQYKVSSSSARTTYGGNSYADGTLLPPLDEEFDTSDIEPFDANKKSKTKPYVPPSNFNPESPMPFGMNIDAPLN